MEADPKANAAALGVPDGFLPYVGQSCFDPGMPDIHGTDWQEGVFRRVGPVRLLWFWITHPAQLWKLLEKTSDLALSYPPFWLGNWEKGVDRGVPSFSLFSKARSHLPRSPLLHLGLPLLAAIAALFRSRQKTLSKAGRYAWEGFSVLLISTAAQFVLVPVTSGLPDLGRHLYPFNFLFDASLLLGLSWLVSAPFLRARADERTELTLSSPAP